MAARHREAAFGGAEHNAEQNQKIQTITPAYQDPPRGVYLQRLSCEGVSINHPSGVLLDPQIAKRIVRSTLQRHQHELAVAPCSGTSTQAPAHAGAPALEFSN